MPWPLKGSGNDMKIDRTRIQNYLMDIKSRTLEIEGLLERNRNEEILSQTWLIRGLKYLLIEIAEIMANTITHIHAKDKGESVTDYVETIIKSGESGIISESLSAKLKPFFDFRNSLVHRYWIISDEKLISLVRENYRDFYNFIE
jgi:uncharacterized protein YutE (UPF0331/DUF86 family)